MVYLSYISSFESHSFFCMKDIIEQWSGTQDYLGKQGSNTGSITSNSLASDSGLTSLQTKEAITAPSSH